MEKPTLNRMWHTYIKLGLPSEITLKLIQDVIRFKIYPLISDLQENEFINWYHFLIHPNPKDSKDSNLYFHIRFSVKKEINNIADLNLPHYCEENLTEKINPIYEIKGINSNILKKEEIEEAWKIIGEQSEWVINMINIHKEDIEIPTIQIIQFMHFFMNMFGLGMQAQLKMPPFCTF